MSTTDYRQGDYRVVADRLRPAAEQLVAWCAPQPGDVVVDVAAGSGNVARLCRDRGAVAVAVDRVREQLALGRDDGAAGVHWVAGDAHALPLAGGVAAAALSTFGVIYADRPDVAVRELARVCRPGGTLGLTAWPAGGYQEASAVVLRELVGGPSGGHDHIAIWGDEQRIAERLSSVADDVEIRSGELVAAFPSLDAWWASRATTAPPIVSARTQLDDASFAELGRRMREAAARFGDTGDDGFVLRDTYLLALARVR